MTTRCGASSSTGAATHVGGDEIDQTVDGGGRMAFKWDDNGQEEGSEQKDTQA